MLPLALLGLQLSSAALASEDPTIDVRDDGTVVGRMVLDAPETSVRAAITDMQRTPSSSDVLDLKLHPEGDCFAIVRTTRGLWSPLQMRTRLCPTSQGWREHLVESTDFDAYDIEWRVRPGGAGSTEVQLSVRSSVNLAVPAGLVRQSTIRGVRESLAAMLKRVLAPHPKP